MAIYILILLFSLLLMNSKESKIKKILVFILMILMILVLGLRTVGTDYNLYGNIYKSITFTNFYRIEYGIKFIMKLFYTNGFPYSIFNLFVATITIVNFVYGILKNDWSDKRCIGIAIFVLLTMDFYSKSFNIMKQMIAVSFAFISLGYVKKESFLKFAICILIGSLFHKTILIFLPAYFATMIFNSKHLSKLVVLLTIFVALFYPNIITLLSYSEQYSMYATYDIGITSGMATYLTIAMNSFFIYKIYKNRSEIKDEKIISVLLLSFPFLVLSIFNNLFMRVGIYFFTSFIYLIPKLIVVNKKNGKKIENVIIILILCGFYLCSVRFLGGIYPYKSIFDINSYTKIIP